MSMNDSRNPSLNRPDAPWAASAGADPLRAAAEDLIRRLDDDPGFEMENLDFGPLRAALRRGAQGGPSLDVERLRELIAKAIWSASTSAYFGGSPSWGPKNEDEWWASVQPDDPDMEAADRVIADARLSVGEPRP